MKNNLKMYILIPDDVPSAFAPVSAAHAALMGHLAWGAAPWDTGIGQYEEWLETSFRKVVCKVSREEFNNAKSEAHNIIVTESNLMGIEVAMAFCPRDEWSSKFKYYKLWK
jgi:peptidyl-tRNA hydrolase